VSSNSVCRTFVKGASDMDFHDLPTWTGPPLDERSLLLGPLAYGYHPV
jgi:hypothetical protein